MRRRQRWKQHTLSFFLLICEGFSRHTVCFLVLAKPNLGRVCQNKEEESAIYPQQTNFKQTCKQQVCTPSFIISSSGGGSVSSFSMKQQGNEATQSWIQPGRLVAVVMRFQWDSSARRLLACLGRCLLTGRKNNSKRCSSWMDFFFLFFFSFDSPNYILIHSVR